MDGKETDLEREALGKEQASGTKSVKVTTRDWQSAHVLDFSSYPWKISSAQWKSLLPIVRDHLRHFTCMGVTCWKQNPTWRRRLWTFTRVDSFVGIAYIQQIRRCWTNLWALPVTDVISQGKQLDALCGTCYFHSYSQGNNSFRLWVMSKWNCTATWPPLLQL